MVNASSRRAGIPGGKVPGVLSLFNIMLNLMLSHALSMPYPPPVRSPSRPFLVPSAPRVPYPVCSPRLCSIHASSVQGNPKKCCLISEGFGIKHYSLFGGFPDGAGFPLQSFLRQKRISAPIPNPRHRASPVCPSCPSSAKGCLSKFSSLPHPHLRMGAICQAYTPTSDIDFFGYGNPKWI